MTESGGNVNSSQNVKDVALTEALDRIRQGAAGMNMQRLRPEHAKALLTEINRLIRTLAAVERARDIEHRARRSLQQALKELCAQHIGGEL